LELTPSWKSNTKIFRKGLLQVSNGHPFQTVNGQRSSVSNGQQVSVEISFMATTQCDFHRLDRNGARDRYESRDRDGARDRDGTRKRKRAQFEENQEDIGDAVVSDVLTGLCQCGAWGCSDKFNRLEERISQKL